MKDEKFAEVYKKYGELVMRVLMNRCKDKQLAQKLCQKVFQGYYLRMNAISDNLTRSWLMWFASMEVTRYNERQKGTYFATYMRGGSQENERKVRQVLDSLAKNHEDVRILEELKEEHEEWYQMVLLASVFGLDDQEMAEYLSMPTQELRLQLFDAKKYLKHKYLEEFKQECREILYS